MTERYLRGTYEPDEFNVDYDALEHLLIAIIDGFGDSGTDRRKRLRTAYEALTGMRVDRVDEPDSEIAKALAEYFRLEEETFENQELPEHGGPDLELTQDIDEFDDKAVYNLAVRAAAKFDDSEGNLVEYIYRRIKGTYRNKLIQSNALGYNAALAEQHYSYDKDSLDQLRADLTEVRRIMKRYNIPMKLEKSFWRLDR